MIVPPNSQDGPRTSRAGDDTKTQPKSFKLFLGTLSPSLSDLLDVFVAHGVASENDFSELLRLPVATRELLFLADMKLNSFQFHRLRTALETYYVMVYAEQAEM